MDTGTLLAHLFLAFLAAFGVWLAVRNLCARHRAGLELPPTDSPATANTADGEEKSAALVYRQAFTLRIWALILCLMALAAWFLDAGWPLCLPLAGLGCYLLYLAYRLRTSYILGGRHKTDEPPATAEKHAPPSSQAAGECRE